MSDLIARPSDGRPSDGRPSDGRPSDASRGVTRDRWGRPLLECPDGITRPFTRASGAGKPLEDQSKLVDWAKRITLMGAGRRPELGQFAQTCVPEDRDDRARLNELAEEAFVAGGGKSAAAMGTSVHKLVELDERGESIPKGVPASMLADLDAYRRERDRIGWVTVTSETFVALDWVGYGGSAGRWEVGGLAGSFDQLGGIDNPRAADRGFGGLLIGDVKTGQHHPGDYSGLGYSMQAGVYAHGLVPGPLGARTPLAEHVGRGGLEVNRQKAIIWWLPAGRAECTACVVDISGAMRNLELADKVLRHRKLKGLVSTP